MKSSQRLLSFLISALFLMTCLTWVGDIPLAEAQQDIQVNAADPPSTPQGTISLNVSVKGKGFKRGAQAKWFVTGTTNPGGVTVNSTSYVSSGELVANITVADDAVLANFDIQVQNSDGRTGKGIELFSVTEKTTGQQPDPDIVVTDLNGNLSVRNAGTTLNTSNYKDILRPKPKQKGSGTPSWSPDGSQIVFASDYNGIGIYIINKDGTGLCKVLALNDQQSWKNARPVWSPLPLADGKYRIAYRDTTTTTDAYPKHIFVVNADCQNPGIPADLTVSAGQSNGNDPTWSPLANKIALSGQVAGPPYLRLFVYDVAVLNGQVVVTSTTNLTESLNVRFSKPEWSPNGDQILASGDVCFDGACPSSQPPWDLWIVDFINPANSYSLTNTTDRGEQWMSWSPNASEIFYHYIISNGRGYDAKAVVATGAITDLIGNSLSLSWRKCFRVCPLDKPGCQLCK